MRSTFYTLLLLALAIGINPQQALAISSTLSSTTSAAQPQVINGFGVKPQSLKAAAKEFKATTTRAERKEMKRDLRTAYRGADTSISKVALIIIALFIPPLAMLLYDGLGKRFWISLLLTLLFFLPGLIYTIFIIATDK